MHRNTHTHGQAKAKCLQLQFFDSPGMLRILYLHIPKMSVSWLYYSVNCELKYLSKVDDQKTTITIGHMTKEALGVK